MQADGQIARPQELPGAVERAPSPWDALQRAHPSLETLELILHDTHGIPRGKWLPASSAAKVWSQPISLPRSIFALDIWGREVTETGLHLDCGDIDGACAPVAGTLAPVPWSDGRSAQTLITMSVGGSPCAYDPRQIASAACGRLAAMGLFPCVAFELEFYLCREAPSPGGVPEPVAPRSCGPAVQNMYALDDLEAVAPFLASVRAAAAVQNIAADSMLSEAAPGQFEINLKHCQDAMRAADEALLLKRVISSCARRFGFRASFMPKPFLDQAGSGLHVHVSLLNRAGANVFATEGEGDRLLEYAAAGLVLRMADFALVFVPGYNGYRRLAPESYAPTWPSWGYDNRSVAVRVPAVERANRRLEHRISGADANPYLVLAALLHGISDGIQERRPPPPPVSGNAYQNGGQPLPASMRQAIDIFANSAAVTQNFGAAYRDMFVKVKRKELKEFENRVSDLEYQSYL